MSQLMVLSFCMYSCWRIIGVETRCQKGNYPNRSALYVIEGKTYSLLYFGVKMLTGSQDLSRTFYL